MCIFQKYNKKADIVIYELKSIHIIVSDDNRFKSIPSTWALVYVYGLDYKKLRIQYLHGLDFLIKKTFLKL